MKTKITIQHIDSIEKVKQFFKEIYDDGTNLHPDTDFTDYITVIDGKIEGLSYPPRTANVLNRMMSQAFRVCQEHNEDIYGIGIDIMYAHPDYQFLKEKQ